MKAGMMFTFSSDSFSLFGFRITYYAVIITAGAILGALLSAKEAKRRGLDPHVVWDVLPWCFIFGLIGARLWHIFTPSPSILVNGQNPYFLDPRRILDLRSGGLGIPGAVIAAVITIWVYTRVKKFDFTPWLDVGAPGLALAQAIGRWGNFINQEIYGLPTTATKFPFAIFIDEAHRFANHLDQAYYLPIFFYESLWNLINLFLLLWLPRKLGDKMLPGDNACVYLIVYPFGRFMLEFLRLERASVAGININQTFMALLAVFFSIVLYLKHHKRKNQPVSST